MEFQDFETEFIQRTLMILQQYDQYAPVDKEKFEVTLLINCLVALLVLPQQKRFNEIPDISIDLLGEWGIRPEFISCWGTGVPRPTLRALVHRLRNSVSHLQIEPKGDGKEITQIEFRDRNGFCAAIPVSSLNLFVRKFAGSFAGVQALY
ncbi:MAG: hypothetical protein HY707_04810 [Ignavibacteriae bacterium]|nr:hypothetical protein [Ignavibacteriota bacterium]